jgi:hypothetical protein
VIESVLTKHYEAKLVKMDALRLGKSLYSLNSEVVKCDGILHPVKLVNKA